MSGGNDIAFTVKPYKGTNAEEKHFTTGIKDDEDGFGTVDLEYGDWVLTEDDAPAGFEKSTQFTFMSYDAKTDLYTLLRLTMKMVQNHSLLAHSHNLTTVKKRMPMLKAHLLEH